LLVQEKYNLAPRREEGGLKTNFNIPRYSPTCISLHGTQPKQDTDFTWLYFLYILHVSS